MVSAVIYRPVHNETRAISRREVSSHVRFQTAQGRCKCCGRAHLAGLRCLPDGGSSYTPRRQEGENASLYEAPDPADCRRHGFDGGLASKHRKPRLDKRRRSRLLSPAGEGEQSVAVEFNLVNLLRA
jgi:hypothetical protein